MAIFLLRQQRALERDVESDLVAVAKAVHDGFRGLERWHVDAFDAVRFDAFRKSTAAEADKTDAQDDGVEFDVARACFT